MIIDHTNAVHIDEPPLLCTLHDKSAEKRRLVGMTVHSIRTEQYAQHVSQDSFGTNPREYSTRIDITPLSFSIPPRPLCLTQPTSSTRCPPAA